MKIALVGCAPTWTDAPYQDATWKIWAHASTQPLGLPRVDRWFDLHQVEVWRQGKSWYRPQPGDPPTYVAWLASRSVPVLMQAHYPVIPTSVRYPLRAIVEAFEIVPATWALDATQWWTAVKHRGEFSSTAAYMLALALYECVEEVALYGIDFIGQDPAGLERRTQRAGMKYWVGLARGLGVPVTVAAGSWFEYGDVLYGYEPSPSHVAHEKKEGCDGVYTPRAQDRVR